MTMTFTIKVGTELDAGGPPADAYVIEKITHRNKVYTVEARTIRQRCFPRDLTGHTTWTDMELLALLNKGTLSISDPRKETL
jgi:hypothetical protein